ncbi:MAG: hypothetical protein FWD16_06055 [Clostridia bacterium]|nr:hypothetical protein [Clostridia bacterium]
MKGKKNMKSQLSVKVNLIMALAVLCLIVILVIMMNVDTLSEKNTSEFSATINSIIIFDNFNEGYPMIQTEEYGDINTSGIIRVLDINDLVGLQVGQMIFFRVKNSLLDNMPEINGIVSLRSNVKDIVSLDSLNEYNTMRKILPSIAALTFAFFLINAFDILDI